MFGYYFEVTNSFEDLVPEYFIRKQTLTNAERYTTDELKNLEDVIMGAEDKLVSLGTTYSARCVTPLRQKWCEFRKLPAPLRQSMCSYPCPPWRPATIM